MHPRLSQMSHAESTHTISGTSLYRRVSLLVDHDHDRQLIVPPHTTDILITYGKALLLLCLFFLFSMDIPANPEVLAFNGQPVWVPIFDLLYSHALLWPTVPPHSQAVELWLRRLVQLEVCIPFCQLSPTSVLSYPGQHHHPCQTRGLFGGPA